MQWQKALKISALVTAGVLVAGVAWAGHLTYKGYNVVHVLVNGQEVASQVPAINFEGSTMMPVRAISEALGAKVGWDGATQTVTVDTAGGAVATVNGKAISAAELNARLQQQHGTQMLNLMIREELIRQEAAKAGVTVTEADVTAEIDRIKEQVGGEANYIAALNQNGLTVASFTNQVRHQLLAQKIVRGIVEGQITEAAVKAYYESNLLRLRYADTQVRASHILVATEAEAKQVLERLAKGEKFADLAVALSTDPSAQGNKGDLDFFGVGMMVPEFEKAAFALKVGERSAPVKTAFGWHILEVTDRKDGAVITEEAALASARKELLDQKVQEGLTLWLNDLLAKAQIQNNLGK